MSLKVMHAVFILLAATMSARFAWWAGERYADAGGAGLLGLSGGAALGCLLLLVYDAAFVRRCRREGWS